jgi:bifunctional non-homologous end joining protein LigD
MPDTIAPMLARLASRLPIPDQSYGFELKWDGIRAIAFLDRGRMRLQSRNLLDLTYQYPELSGMARAFHTHQAILDGEIVALDESGTPRFERLQQRLGLDIQKVSQRMSQIAATYMIFDLLFADGHNIMPLAYCERRELLSKWKISGCSWQTTPWSEGGGQHTLETSRKFKFEGIIAKRLDSAYEPGARSGAWLKIKNVRRQEFVIGGWTSGRGWRFDSLGSLLMGYNNVARAMAAKSGAAQALIYCGKVGTGFTDKLLAELQRLLRPLHSETCPFTPSREIPRRSHFVVPRLVGEVEFTEWTQAGILRQPSFKGLRMDKDPRDVVREESS